MRFTRMLLIGSALALGPATQAVPAASPEAAGTYQMQVKEAKARIREITVAEVQRMRTAGEEYLLVDVREDHEWEAGHAAGAVHIGRGVLEKEVELKAPKKDGKMVLYCHSGARSALATDTLVRMGYSNVFSLAGGINAWQAAGLPVVK